MSDFSENLRQLMFDKRCKAIDVARATKITPSTISRYLSGTHQPTTQNLFAISQYLEVSPESLLSSSDAPESLQRGQTKPSVTEPLLKVIEVQEELIKNLQKQVKEWEESKDTSKERHAKGKAKNPTKPKKQKVGFMKKHKKPKK